LSGPRRNGEARPIPTRLSVRERIRDFVIESPCSFFLSTPLCSSLSELLYQIRLPVSFQPEIDVFYVLDPWILHRHAVWRQSLTPRARPRHTSWHGLFQHIELVMQKEINQNSKKISKLMLLLQISEAYSYWKYYSCGPSFLIHGTK
jgi:hypothetical protein